MNATAVTAPVFDIQRFSLHDGPGIRTTVFLKGCLLDCVWCQNPESKSRKPVIAFYANRCLKSFECRAICPADAILDGDFRIDYDRCTNCNLCLDACPSGALKKIGAYMTAEELFAEASRDKEYFADGGISVSGGEPTIHAKFLIEFFTLCRTNKIQTLLQTSGYFRAAVLEDVVPLVDRIWFDLKLMDEKQHIAFTRRKNQVILRNASALIERGAPVEFRIPLIEGITDTDDNLTRTAGFLLDHGVTSVQVLKYHNMGEAKIDIVQSRQRKLHKGAYSEARFTERKTFLENLGLSVVA